MKVRDRAIGDQSGSGKSAGEDGRKRKEPEIKMREKEQFF